MPASRGRFPHLPFPKRIEIPTERPGGGAERSAKTKRLADPVNRSAHATTLQNSITTLRTEFQNEKNRRLTDRNPSLPEAISFFLEIDPKCYEPDSLSAFGIEVLSEADGGIVIGASSDASFGQFEEKLRDFLDLSLRRNASPAKVWSIQGGTAWRIERLFSAQLQALWPSIELTNVYTADVTIVAKGLKKVPSEPRQEDYEDEKKFNSALQRFYLSWDAWDALMTQRQEEFEDYIHKLQGEIISPFYNDAPAHSGVQVDSFSCRVQLSGKALKDLGEKYPFLAELTEPDETKRLDGSDEPPFDGDEFELDPPDADAATVCVIDSGIQEDHKYLDTAIRREESLCFIPGETNVSDRVRAGGHGTRVAGAILFPKNVPQNGTVKSHAWIQNARVLNEFNQLPLKLFPPALIRDIVRQFNTTRLFNHSINSTFPHRPGRMSAWAASIDHLSYERDILFIVSAGNIDRDAALPTRECVQTLVTKAPHPNFLLRDTCRVANPGQSLNALTVGSVALAAYGDNIWQSIAGVDQPSAFSRTGLGLWGSIKPEVVEYGGDFVRNQGTPLLLQMREETSPELVRSTLFGGPAHDRDAVGTSFAAPKVTHIAAELARRFPEQPTLLYRALIVQSARWPAWAANLPVTDVVRLIGYGIPDFSRATENNEFRVTVITNGKKRLNAGNMDLYEIPIPDEMRQQGEDHRVRVEVTLSYCARPHRLRRTTRRYLSTWLDWNVNKTDETPKQFEERIKQRHDQSDPHPWTISKLRRNGAEGVQLSDSTVQKDWTVVECFNLPEVFCVAVVAHEVSAKKEANDPAEYALAVTFESEGATVPVYNLLRASLQIPVEPEIEIDTVE